MSSHISPSHLLHPTRRAIHKMSVPIPAIAKGMSLSSIRALDSVVNAVVTPQTPYWYSIR